MSNNELFISSNQVKMMVESISNEKNLPVEMIFSAMENALAASMQKGLGVDCEIHVSINRKTGDSECFRIWRVVADEQECDEILSMKYADAKKLVDNIEVGESFREPIAFLEGRIFAHQTGQMITKFVREAERVVLAEKYSSRVGELFSGQVKRVTKDIIVVDLGDRVEGGLSRKEILPREIFRVGDRVRSYLYGVDVENKGPVLMLSRTNDNMLIELFKLEVPEVQEGVLEIKSAARDPGVRSKIAVKTKDSRIDAVGACVGMRGGRVQAVSSELNNERVDIILWDDSPAKMVISAMSPAEISSVVIDEEANAMDVIVADENLSQAIGRGGQNVRLASKLVGWSLNVISQTEADAKKVEAPVNVLAELCESLDVDTELAEILIREGYDSLDNISSAGVENLVKIAEFDADIAEEIYERAKSGLLAEVISLAEAEDGKQPLDCLLALEGMPKLVAYRLAANGIVSAEDLAEHSVIELKHIKGLNESLAGELIMAARKPWFESKD